jgi:hypothetical protein
MLSHYSRTRKGNQELKARTYKLTARQRALLLIIENVQWNDSDSASVKQLVTGDNLQCLIDLQLIEAVNESGAVAYSQPEPEPEPEAELASKVLAKAAKSHAAESSTPQRATARKPANAVVAKPSGTADVQKNAESVLNDAQVSALQLALFEPAQIQPAQEMQAASQAAAQTVATSTATTETAEQIARRSVFLSYLPYLSGSKVQAEKVVDVAASVTELTGVEATVVVADSSAEVVAEVQEAAADTETVIEVLQAVVELPVVVVEPPLVDCAVDAGTGQEQVADVQEAAETETIAEIEATAEIAVEIVEPVVFECAVEALTEQVADLQQAAGAETVAELEATAEVTVEIVEPVVVDCAIEAVTDLVADVEEAAAETETVDEVLEAATDACQEESVALGRVNVISTMTISAAQSQSLQSGVLNELAHVHVEVLTAQPAEDDGMLYIADHNKKWQERHIPLLVWTVTLPDSTRQKQKKLELPLKFYNMDEFDQVWDAKPPYGSH